MSRRSWVAVGWVVSLALAVAVGWFAARWTLVPPAVAAHTHKVVLYRVREGKVGDTQNFSATARWPTDSTLPNRASGVVTSVGVSPGATVQSGTVLYSVDLRPVIAARGSVPSFRTLREGDRGPDVSQLNAFLAGQGLLAAGQGDSYSSATAAAVRAWQGKLGTHIDGVVRSSDFIFFPRLPARVVLSPMLSVGSQVSEGVGGVRVLGSSPSFVVILGQGQANLVPLRGTVLITGRGSIWQAKIVRSVTTQTGDLRLDLAGVDGRPVCRRQCGAVSAVGSSLFPARIVVVPTTSGPLVPLSAIRTSPGGGRSVVDAAGKSLRVTVRASANGEAVVSGVAVGSRVRLFASGAQGG
ncbi:MAG TPA: peptidoglycan-binding domain-containing protein [Nocardioidaceae bacterium]|nr:peptidoglycan-binding domain-containing protein [Nocardioidaceae bacterium]